MHAYSLAVNGTEVCTVVVDAPAWLPVAPRLPKVWLTAFTSRALRRWFCNDPAYLRCDRSPSSLSLN